MILFSFHLAKGFLFIKCQQSYAPAIEAATLRLPVFGITDTNTWSQTISLPIPGNDEAAVCAIFYNDLISGYILLRKYTLVLMWLVNIRSVSRVVSFSNWLRTYYSFTLNKFDSFKALATFRSSKTDSLVSGMSLFFSKGYYANNTLGNQLDVFGGEKPITVLSSTVDSIFKRRSVLQKMLNWTFIKKMISRRKTVLNSKFLSYSRFKVKFLKKRFLKKKLIFRFDYTRGQFHSFKFDLDTRFFDLDGFFLNMLIDLIFYTRYCKYFSRFHLRHDRVFIRKSNFNYIKKLVSWFSPRFLYGFNSLFGKTNYKNSSFYNVNKGVSLNLFVKSYSFNGKPLSRLPESKLLHLFKLFQVEEQNMRLLDFRNFIIQDDAVYRLPFSVVLRLWRKLYSHQYTFSNQFFLKSPSSSAKRLRFFVDNFAFRRYIKTNLTWYLNTILPLKKQLANTAFTYYFYAGQPILFRSFLGRNYMKKRLYGELRFKTTLWLWF